MTNKLFHTIIIVSLLYACTPLTFESKKNKRDDFLKFLNQEEKIIKNEIKGKKILILPMVSSPKIPKNTLESISAKMIETFKKDQSVEKLILPDELDQSLSSENKFNLNLYLNTLRDISISNLDLAKPIASQIDADYFLFSQVNLWPEVRGKLAIQTKLFDIKNNRLLWIALDIKKDVQIEDAQTKVLQMAETIINVLITRYRTKNYQQRYHNLRTL